MSRTMYAKKEWFEFLQNHCMGSSGSGGSLSGMRRCFWGNEAYVIRCCKYLFRVNEATFKYVAEHS